jgi:hypothetical protein
MLNCMCAFSWYIKDIIAIERSKFVCGGDLKSLSKIKKNDI